MTVLVTSRAWHIRVPRSADVSLDEIQLGTNEVMTENLAYYTRHGYTEAHQAEQDGFHRVFYRKLIDRTPDSRQKRKVR